LAAWTVLERIDMLTGFFGSGNNAGCHLLRDNYWDWVAELAIRTCAISFTPLYQALEWMGESFVHPSFWLFFGYYRRITVPANDPEVSDESGQGLAGGVPWLGNDMWRDLLPLEQVPQWKRNDVGSAFLRNVGHIKMKPPDFGRWFEGCFQTCLWLGTSTPSVSSQMRGNNRKNKGQPKGKGKGKGKGN